MTADNYKRTRYLMPHNSNVSLIRAEVQLVFPSPDGRRWREATDEGYGTEHGVAEFMVTICSAPNPHPQPLPWGLPLVVSRRERGFCS